MLSLSDKKIQWNRYKQIWKVLNRFLIKGKKVAKLRYYISVYIRSIVIVQLMHEQYLYIFLIFCRKYDLMKTKEVNGRNGMLQSTGILYNEIWNGTSFYCSLCIVFVRGFYILEKQLA